MEERTAAAEMLAEERSGRAVAEAALAEERAARAAAEAALAEERAARTAAAEAATLQARIAEIERTASDDALERRAAAQAAAAAATAAPAAEQAGRLTADLDAAAAALRARMQPPGRPAVGTAPGESPSVLEATQPGRAGSRTTPDGVTATVDPPRPPHRAGRADRGDRRRPTTPTRPPALSASGEVFTPRGVRRRRVRRRPASTNGSPFPALRHAVAPRHPVLAARW